MTELDGMLQSKEIILKAVKEKHIELQKQIVSAMNNQFHSKIQTLEAEIQQLERERAESVQKAPTAAHKSNLEENYRRKLRELQE